MFIEHLLAAEQHARPYVKQIWRQSDGVCSQSHAVKGKVIFGVACSQEESSVTFSWSRRGGLGIWGQFSQYGGIKKQVLVLCHLCQWPCKTRPVSRPGSGSALTQCWLLISWRMEEWMSCVTGRGTLGLNPELWLVCRLLDKRWCLQIRKCFFFSLLHPPPPFLRSLEIFLHFLTKQRLCFF